MNMKPIVAVAIALTVGIVTFSGVLIPAIQSGVDTEDTFTNKGYYDMTYTEIDDVSLSWDHTKPDRVTVNGDEVILQTPTVGSARTIICGDDWIIRYSVTNNGILGIEYDSPDGVLSANAAGNKDATLVASNGSMTITVGTGSRTTSYSYIYCVANEGSYVMKESTENAYLNSDSTIYAMGVTFSIIPDVSSIYLKTSGTIEDGLTSSAFIVNGTAQDVTVGTPVLTYTEISSHKDLYSLEKFTVDVTDGTNTGNATYTYFIVPAEVTAEKSVHADASTILLFQTIPVFIVLGMIVAVVGVLYMKTRR